MSTNGILRSFSYEASTGRTKSKWNVTLKGLSETLKYGGMLR